MKINSIGSCVVPATAIVCSQILGIFELEFAKQNLGFLPDGIIHRWAVSVNDYRYIIPD